MQLIAVISPLVGGCAAPQNIDPIAWWHELEGGAIAQQRPSPPASDQPYPNLAAVPPKPTPPDPAMRQRLSSALLADRNNADYAAAQAPLVAPPRMEAAAKPPAADPDASSASLEASQSPPRKPVPGPPPPTPDARPVANASPPSIPDAPPPPPVLPGISIGPTVPTPPPKPPARPAVVLTPSEAARAPVPIAFPAGSAVLPVDALGPLRLLAIRRAGVPIAIFGFGEADDTLPQVQTAGISLGMARARAIAVALIADGVPATALRLNAEAAGRGADARLVD